MKSFHQSNDYKTACVLIIFMKMILFSNILNSKVIRLILLKSIISIYDLNQLKHVQYIILPCPFRLNAKKHNQRK